MYHHYWHMSITKDEKVSTLICSSFLFRRIRLHIGVILCDFAHQLSEGALQRVLRAFRKGDIRIRQDGLHRPDRHIQLFTAEAMKDHDPLFLCFHDQMVALDGGKGKKKGS